MPGVQDAILGSRGLESRVAERIAAPQEDGSTAPLISVGMPTYNGARFLRQSLDSLLAQDWARFELVISDNASNDETAAIAAEYVERDQRIRYIRQHERLSVAENFRRAFVETEADLFMWAADHDLWSPNYLSASLASLQANSACVLAFPDTTQIDAENAEVGPMPSTPEHLSDQTALARYRRLMWGLVFGNMIYGLIRRAALKRTTVGRPLIGADHLVLAELALQGPFQFVHGARFFRREWRSETDDQLTARRVAAMGIDRANYRALRDGHLEAVRHADTLSRVEKVVAYLDTIRCFRVRFGV